jgi:hypothetical protein
VITTTEVPEKAIRHFEVASANPNETGSLPLSRVGIQLRGPANFYHSGIDAPGTTAVSCGTCVDPRPSTISPPRSITAVFGDFRNQNSGISSKRLLANRLNFRCSCYSQVVTGILS